MIAYVSSSKAAARNYQPVGCARTAACDLRRSSLLLLVLGEIGGARKSNEETKLCLKPKVGRRNATSVGSVALHINTSGMQHAAPSPASNGLCPLHSEARFQDFRMHTCTRTHENVDRSRTNYNIYRPRAECKGHTHAAL
jgi:hypothetical protein